MTNALTARVQKLEHDARRDPTRPAVIVDWDNTPDSELEPGTLVIEWGPNDQVISRRIKATDQKQRG
jgi:hypothetical protein